MIAKRLGAVAVSIALIAGAFAVRSRLDKNEELEQVPLRVACAAELGEACERLRDRGFTLVVEDALATARRLATQQPGTVDTEVWLTVQPAAALVNTDRTRRALEPLFTPDAVRPVARSELALVVWRDRGAVLQRACATLTMRCVGEVAGKGAWSESGGRPEWGQVKVALPDPGQTASGVLSLGAGAQSWFGRNDIGSNDFDADSAFGDWLSGLSRAAPRDGSLARMLAVGRSALDMAIVPRAVAEEQAAGATDVLTLALAPTTPVEVVAVTLPASRSDGADLAGAVRWPAAPPRGSALAADVLEALQLRWQDLSR